MLKLAPILKEISKDFRMGGHDGSGGHDGKLHQAFTLVMEWEAVEYLKVSRWDQKSQITTVEPFNCVVDISGRINKTSIAVQHIQKIAVPFICPSHLVTRTDKHGRNACVRLGDGIFIQALHLVIRLFFCQQLRRHIHREEKFRYLFEHPVER